MNVYIQMEISVRELEGRLLLALAAAEQGHPVLLGNVRPYLTAEPQAFPPGLFHDKSLTPSRRKLDFFSGITEAGFVLSSQDEEHWLALPSFSVPAVRRFSAETLDLAARSLAWGDHEARALTARYPESAKGTVTATGSPRGDLWREEFEVYHRARPLKSLAGRTEYVLFSSNFSAVLDVNPFWIKLRDKRQQFIDDDDPFEFDRYPHAAKKLVVLAEFVRAIRRLAKAHPDVLMVVRPHPIEAQGAWLDLLGPTPNVLVTRERSLISWIRGARVVVQNECTSAFEAAVSGTPVISFHPDGIFADHPPNALGRRCSTASELDSLIREAVRLEGDARDGWLDDDARALLADRLTGTTGALATDRIVAEWTAAGQSLGPTKPFSVASILAARRSVRLRDAAVRSAVRARSTITGVRSAAARGEEHPTGAFQIDHKFPALRQGHVEGVATDLARTLGRFSGARVRVIAPDLVAITPRPPDRVGRGHRP